jgi:hypothetical protein
LPFEKCERNIKPLFMAQKPLITSSLEIEEIDQANNLVATYIQTPFNEKDSRIDVVVSYSSSLVLCVHYSD